MPKKYYKGGEGAGRSPSGIVPSATVEQTGGSSMPRTSSPSTYDTTGGYARSQYYTISGGGSRKRKQKRTRQNSKKQKRKQRGGNAVLAAAAVPFGLLALQRYFTGKTAKNKSRKMKRTFRKHRGGFMDLPLA